LKVHHISNLLGVDTTNACYGGTNALFNSINWLESKSWDGRLAICVAADIAVYKTGPARPTGGAGAIAILLGPNAPLVFEQGLRTTHIEHVYDFYKPDLHSEYPEVDGPLSNKCYTKALDIVYNRYMNKTLGNLEMIDYALFHCPYTKLVQKSLARLVYNDFKRGNDTYSSKIHGEVPNIYRNVELEKSYNDRELLLEFIKRTRDLFEKKVGVGLKCATLMGNMYCGSVYFGLVSLLSTVKSDLLVNIIFLNLDWKTSSFVFLWIWIGIINVFVESQRFY
jgi:hydroxymethylglutaryl-CoA synthase